MLSVIKPTGALGYFRSMQRPNFTKVQSEDVQFFRDLP
jgi:hypothetical protein